MLSRLNERQTRITGRPAPPALDSRTFNLWFNQITLFCNSNWIHELTEVVINGF